MIGRRARIAVATLAGLGMLQPAAGQQQPVFRASADLVSVDVSVRVGGAPVTGLTADDFVLLDNGVRQRIESVEAVRLPLDLSLVVDVSGGSPEWWGAPRSRSEIVADLTEIVTRSAQMLHQDDRVRLMTVDTYSSEVVPLQRVGTTISVPSSVATAGKASLHDALVATLLLPVEANRRHLIVAVTKAEDAISAVDFAAVQDVARRSEAVLHVVFGTSLVGDTTCRPAPAAVGTPFEVNIGDSSCRFARRRFWQPSFRRVEKLLPALAESTGGRFHAFDRVGFHRDFSDEVRGIAEEFRQGYVLRYAPPNQAREGWHEIAVSVPSRTDLRIEARRGYAVDARQRDDGRPETTGARTTTRDAGTAESLANAFARKEYPAFERALATTPNLAMLLGGLRSSGSPWPDAPRRDAVFALEFAVHGLNRPDNNTREEAVRLLEQQATLIRHPFASDAFECAWYWTGIAALQGVIRPTVARPFVRRALERCPAEARFHLAAAVVADQQWPVGTTWRLPGQKAMLGPTSSQRQEVTRLYDVAMSFPDTAVEARVRAAWFAFRVGEVDRGLQLIQAATGQVPDPQLQYIRLLVQGRLLQADGQVLEATAAFRAALDAWPRAQSARIALMGIQAAHGDRVEAETLSEAVQVASASEFDPWWRYWQGDFRAFSGILARLRGLVQ